MTSTHQIMSQISTGVLVMSHLLLLLMTGWGEGSPFESLGSLSTRGCPESYKKFEIMSGFAFSSPADSFASIPGCLELTSCLSACRNNDSCMAINFETGLCVLLSSSATQKPGLLKESQFPVFTIYAHKVCLSDYGKCGSSRKRRKDSVTGVGGEGVTWVYERVPGHRLALMPDNMHFSSAATDSTSAPSSMEHSSSPNEFVASPDSGENWSPGPESSSPYPAESLDSSQSASYDYTTARNNPMSSGKQATTISQDLVQQEIESAKQHRNNKKTNSKKKTRLSSGLGSARSSSDQRVQEIRASSLLRCAEACLQQTSFPCLSANYQKTSKKCTLMSFDRHSLAIDSDALKISPEEKQELRSAILTPAPTVDYIEMNCRGRNDDIAKADPSQVQFLCDFKPLSGLVLKTVDAIYEGVDSLSECKKKCLEAPFQCYSFDLGEDSSLAAAGEEDADAEVFAQGDPFSFEDKRKKKIKKRVKNSKRTSVKTTGGEKKKSVCRISHLDRSALFHLQDPYSHLPGVTTYERNNCFNVQVACGRDRMKAMFSSTKPFTGKIYSSRTPSTCTQVLEDTHSFAVDVPYFTASSSQVTGGLANSFNPFNRRKASSDPPSPGFTDCGVTATSVRGGRESEREEGSSSSASSLPSSSESHVPGEEKAGQEIRSGTGVHAVSKRSRALHQHKHHHHQEGLQDHQKKHESRLNSSSSSDRSSRPTFARFSVSLVLQRHALIVTSADFDITLNCDYNLSSQKIVSNSIHLYSHAPNEPNWNDLEEVQAVPAAGFPHNHNNNKHKPPSSLQKPPPHATQAIPPPVGGTGVGSVIPVPHVGAPMDPLTHEATFHSPVVRMSITDRNGGPVRSAEVGDPLSLRFEVYTDHGKESMYDVFVKNIVADDGIDTSELELIDDRGCPTDPAIMGPLRRVHVSSISRKVLEAPFEAFKFPTSAIVQFRALIVPCIAGDCQPVVCTISSSALSSSNLMGHPTFTSGSKSAVHSFGKRSIPDDDNNSRNGSRASLARDLLSPHSNESSIAMELLLPPKELEERVFIEVLDKKEEEGEDRPQEEDQETSAQGLERRPEGEDNEDEADKRPDDYKRTVGQSNGSQRRNMRKESKTEVDGSCLSLPTVWLICGLCLLCVQVVCLIRFYVSNRRDVGTRVRYGFAARIKDPIDSLSAY